jgi:hypothetical protein
MTRSFYSGAAARVGECLTRSEQSEERSLSPFGMTDVFVSFEKGGEGCCCDDGGLRTAATKVPVHDPLPWGLFVAEGDHGVYLHCSAGRDEAGC